MSSEHASLGSILPPNYRHRAEAFARDLQQRLWNLGSSRGGATRASSSSIPPHHPAFEEAQSSSSSTCAPPHPPCGCLNLDGEESSSPRSPTDVVEEAPSFVSQNLVNRSDGLPIPHTIDGGGPSHDDEEDEPSARYSFSSDSQQSIYSTPSENFSLTKFSCLHNGLANFSSFSADQQKQLPSAPHPPPYAASCDLFSDLYDSTSESKPSKTKDYNSDNVINHNEPPSLQEQGTRETPRPQVPTMAKMEECFRLSNNTSGESAPYSSLAGTSDNMTECSSSSRIDVTDSYNREKDIYTYSNLEDSFSKISLNGDVSMNETCCNCENNAISRLANLDDEIIESNISDASSIDKNANELDKVKTSSTNTASLDCSVDSAISVDMVTEEEEVPDESLKDECYRTEDDDQEQEQEEDQVIGEMKKTEKRLVVNGEGGCDRVKLRRCSSLKTWKTPPDTPGRKKIVRFADVLGLDLADVRTFLDEIPQVPKSAFSDLQDIDTDDMFNIVSKSSLESTSVPVPKFLCPLFQQPGGANDFFDRLNSRLVCLENAHVTDPALLAISGTIRVRNLDYDKSIFVRFSTDGWKSYADLKAMYVVNSCDGFSDQFSFVLYANNLDIGQRLEFAVMFQSKGTVHWDNNGGINYIFQCVPAPSSNSSTTPGVGSPSISDKYCGFY